jgi:EAL domain-containing protein (putative c-di-GMP-specific phosphodiesterase class I)/GGDEF domain-containing protein
MAEESARLLGFAFASADLLVELDANGNISFALGASKQLAGVDPTTLAGKSWTSFICDEDKAVVEAFLRSVGAGDRRGPIRIGLRPVGGRRLKRFAALCACRLPQLSDRISCALSVHSVAPVAVEPAGPYGLHNAEGLGVLAETAMKLSAQTGVDINMELVELAGLKQAADSLGHTQAAEALSRVAAALRAESIDGSSAAQLEIDRYAFVRARAESSERVAERLGRAMNDAGLPQIKPALDSLELNDDGAGEGLRTLRVALDRFIAGGPAAMASGSLSGMIKQTVDDASKLRVQVAARRFSMAYQPIVSLKTGITDHFEALVRLSDNDSPQESILMAEGMDIIQELDFAVIQAVMTELKKPNNKALRLAANISARSLMQPAFTSKLMETLKGSPDTRGRLIVEITESASIQDLEIADAMVRRLRKEGCKVALDDFGSGAASLDYLRALSVDEVKIDGRYIRELTSATDRNGVLVAHVAELCRELKISTVAEMVETDKTADALRTLGVDFGQGYLFGRPVPEPKAPPIRNPAAPVAARRAGTVSGWG